MARLTVTCHAEGPSRTGIWRRRVPGTQNNDVVMTLVHAPNRIRGLASRPYLPSRQTSNLINQRPNCGSFQLSLCSNLDRPRPGNDARPRGCWRNAASALPPAHLLGARYLDRECLYLFGCRVVGFLSLALSTAVDVFPVRLRSDLA